MTLSASMSRRQLIEGLLSFTVCTTPALGSQAQARDAVAQARAKQAQQGLKERKAPAAWLTLPPTPELGKPLQSGLVDVNQTSVYYAQFGAGPPVLLLHGGLGNSNYWGHQVEALAGRFTVTVMDTRGHGRSPYTSPAFSYRRFADDVVALLDHLSIRAPAVVGWSDGAITGLLLALNNPDRISRLFAFGANSSLDGLKAAGSGGPFAVYKARCKAEYARLSPHPERWPQLLQGLGAMWRREPNLTRQELSSIKTPTVVADGEHDEIIKRAHTEQMARMIPGAKLVILPEVSHFAMLQNPAQFNAALMEFLA